MTFKTPVIPDWIRNLRAEGYTSIFEFNLGNRNLYGTEALLGDWDGCVLVVAKDFAPVEEVKALIDQGVDPQLIYRHNDGDGRYRTGLRTNQRLLRFMYGPDGDQMLGGGFNTTCGACYVNACFFLKNGADPSSNLNAWRPRSGVFEKSAEVFRFVVDNMPNLRAVACLGNDSRILVQSALAGRIGQSSFRIYHLSHPSRGSNAIHQEGWRRLMNESSIVQVGTELRYQPR